LGREVSHAPLIGGASPGLKKILSLIREAIGFHLQGLKENGEEIPQPSSTSEFVEVEAA
jgi:predicted RNase H-like HicB family nuclease